MKGKIIFSEEQLELLTDFLDQALLNASHIKSLDDIVFEKLDKVTNDLKLQNQLHTLVDSIDNNQIKLTDNLKKMYSLISGQNNE